MTEPSAPLHPQQHRPSPQSFAAWVSNGIETGSGRLGSGAALAQMLTLPLLVLLWGVGMTVAWLLM